MPRDNFTMSENSGSFGMQQRQDRFDAIGDLLVGPPGPPGPQGPPGADGTVSFDELTPAQKESLRGEGVPAGGTTGQVLAKSSNTDYATEWVDQSGGGGTTLTAGDGLDITNDVIKNTQGIEYIVGTQTAATSAWTGVSTDETLKVGKIIAYYLPYAGTSTEVTLTLTMGDGSTTDPISLRRQATGIVTTQFAADNVIILIYDGDKWRVSAYYDTTTNTVPTGYCTTAAGTAAKVATCSYGYRGDTNYFPCLFRHANTAANATLAITTYATTALPIYVNGARTSSTNTFSAGVILFLYYNGAYYCYNDGRLPILVDGAVTSVQEYVETKYTKPSGGIPKTDLASTVQTSLDKADSALQSVPSTYRTAAAQDAIDETQDAAIGIVITGKRPSMAVTEGQYVIVRNSTISGITDGLYTANAALSPSTDVTAANLTAVSGGGLNAMQSGLFKNINATETGSTTAGTNAWTYVPVTIPTGYRMMAVNSLNFSGTDANYIVLRGFVVENSNSRVTVYFKNTTSQTTINWTVSLWITCAKKELFA